MLMLNVNNKYECAICHHPYGDVRGLSTHVCKQHKMDAKAYYDQYVKLADEGKCKVCGAPTKFHTIADGYRETCSHKCGNILLKNDPDKMARRSRRKGPTRGHGTTMTISVTMATTIFTARRTR